MENSTLLSETIALLHARRGEYPEIAEATGLGYKWLAALAQGVIDDPGVRKIEKLHAYLIAERAA